MEFKIPFEHEQALIKPEIEQKKMNDYQFDFKKFLSVEHSSFINIQKKFPYEPSNKNGFNKKEEEIEPNHFSWTGSETPSNKPILNDFDICASETPLNSQNTDVNNGRYKSKKLEPKLINSPQFNIFNQNPDYQNHFYRNKRDFELYNDIIGYKPIISREFTSKENVEDNIYNLNEKKIEEFIRKLHAPKTKICKTKQKIRKINQTSEKTYFNVEKKEAKGQNELDLYNIPENFLIDFSLKNIIIKDLQTFKEIENPVDCVYLEDMEDFMITLCNKFVNKNKSEKNINLKDEEDQEYIEFLEFEKKEENMSFLQKKRSNNSGFDDIENLYGEDKGENPNKKKATKKTKKSNKKITKKDKKIIKMNNKKDGLKINLYLNQIQVNNYKLENFPFFPLLKIKENIKIEFLKGIINKKNLIKINKKAECIKDQRNLKYIRNKKFEVCFVNKENNRQYVIYINEFHILHLILYYYYKIQQGIRLMNKYHYSHSSFEKSQRAAKQIESLIKKCNKIVEIITYKKDL
jgi:hypothetical protein